MSKFEYKEGDEFELSGHEILAKAGEVLAAGGTYSLNGKILKITSLPEDKEESKKAEPKKAEEPKAAEEDEKKSTRGSKPKAETSDDKE